MQFENQNNRNFQIPKNAHLRRSSGYCKIPKNAHLRRFLGFPKKIPKNAHLLPPHHVLYPPPLGVNRLKKAVNKVNKSMFMKFNSGLLAVVIPFADQRLRFRTT